jgi:hypothetical protein
VQKKARAGRIIHAAMLATTLGFSALGGAAAAQASHHATSHRHKHAAVRGLHRHRGRTAAVSSVTDRLSSNGGAIEVTAVPTGTTQLHVAIMADLAGHGLKYINIPVSQRLYTPPAATPVVDMQALKSGSSLGGWAGRKQTTPVIVKVEPPKEELSKIEPPKIEPPKIEPPKIEPPKIEPPKIEPPKEEARSSMVVGVDTGGWGGVFGELANGGIRFVRTSSSAAGSHVAAESKAAGVQIASVIFGTGGGIGSISPSGYASQVLAYYKKWGLAGGLSFEVLNEPGGSWFWSDPTNYSAYARIAKAVHEELATLPAGSRPSELCSWDGGQGGSDSFGRGIKAAGALPYCDGVTVHPYGGSSGQHGGALGDRANVERAHAESGLPVSVTEVGWPTATGQSSTGDSQQWTEAQQASNIAGFVNWAKSTGYVKTVILFNLVDYGTNASYGLERSNRQHKASFKTLGELSS